MESRRELVLRAIAERYGWETVYAAGPVTALEENPEANMNSAGSFGGGVANNAAAQAFRLDTTARVIGVDFNLRKLGSPTGPVYARLLSATGSLGSNARPTGGGPFRTSGPLDAASLPTSAAMVPFLFDDVTVLDPSTDYCVGLEYTGGDADNNIVLGIDTIAATHEGNASYRDTATGNWFGFASQDLIFSLKGALPTLKPANLSVHRHKTRQGQKPDVPELVVYYAGERANPAATDEADRLMLVRVQCKTVAPEGMSGDEALDELLTWAEVALLHEFRLGGLVANISLPEIDAVTAREYADTWAEATLQFEVTHQTKWGDPRLVP